MKYLWWHDVQAAVKRPLWLLSRVKCQKSYLHSYSLVLSFLRLYLIISPLSLCTFFANIIYTSHPNDCYLNIHGFMAFHCLFGQLLGLDFSVFSTHTHTHKFHRFFCAIISFISCDFFSSFLLFGWTQCATGRSFYFYFFCFLLVTLHCRWILMRCCCRFFFSPLSIPVFYYNLMLSFGFCTSIIVITKRDYVVTD